MTSRGLLRRREFLAGAALTGTMAAIAFHSTSCNFIIRSVSAAEYCCEVFTLQLPPPLFKADRLRVNSTGQITY